MARLNKAIALGILSICLASHTLAAPREQLQEELVVTAQKMEENPLDVPISMTILDDVAMEDRKINTIEDLGAFTPNMMVFGYQTDNQASVTMRGIYADLETRSNPAGIYVDGIPVIAGFGANEIFNDIERVEVLRGPQGTLYGKNAETGVINVITKQPTNEKIFKAGIDLGSDNKRQVKLKGSGALIKDRLYMSVSGNHYEKEGLLTDKITGETLDDRENNSGKIILRWTPTQALDLSLISSHRAYDDDAIRMSMANQGPNDVTTNFPGFDKSEATTHALKATWDLSENSSMESISSFRHFKTDASIDFDFTAHPTETHHRILRRDSDTLAQEIRYHTALMDGGLSLLVGVNADKKDEDWRNMGEFLDTSLGFFCHTRYRLTPKWNILGGIRLDKDNREFTHQSRGIKEENDGSEVSPKLGLEFKPAPGILTYATAAKGYRPGGFNFRLPDTLLDNVAYGEETLWSYELGSKLSFLNNKLTLTGALFYMDIQDMQVTNPIAPSVEIITNAAEAHSQGIELSLTYRPTPTLSFFTSFGYTEAEFDSYTGNVFNPSGQIVGTQNYKGNTNPFAPKYNFNIGAQYRNASGIFARVDVNGYGKMYFDKANTVEKKAYQLVNAKIGYEGEHFDLYLYGKNLFDENHDSKGYYNGYFTIYEDPREIGVQLTYRY